MIHVFVRICCTTHVPGKSPVIPSTSSGSWEKQLAVCLFSFRLGRLVAPSYFLLVCVSHFLLIYDAATRP